MSFAGSDVLMSRQTNGQNISNQSMMQPILVTDKVTAKQNSDRMLVEAAIG
jgi:hypothetical protein